jgi:hypothetical protein
MFAPCNSTCLENGIVGKLTGPVAWLRGSYRQQDFTSTTEDHFWIDRDSGESNLTCERRTGSLGVIGDRLAKGSGSRAQCTNW